MTKELQITKNLTCKYPTIVDDREDLFADDSPCMKCPLTKL